MKRITCRVAVLLAVAVSLNVQAQEFEQRALIAAVRWAAPSVQWDLSSITKADLNGDHRDDLALVGVQKDTLVVGVVLGPVKRGARAHTIAIAVCPKCGICGLPVKPRAEVLQCTQQEEQLPGCRESEGARALWLVGPPECEPVMLYWEHDNKYLQAWRRW